MDKSIRGIYSIFILKTQYSAQYRLIRGPIPPSPSKGLI